MNKTLALMINSIEPRQNKERAHILAEGLLAIKDSLKNTNIDLNEEVNFDETYKEVLNSMKGGSLLNKLNPTYSGYRGTYDVQGADFTLCFWMYMLAEIVEQEPQDINAWIRFGNKMNSYMYDVDPYIKHMVSSTAAVDKFPIAKLLNNFSIYDNIALPKIMLHVLKSDMALEALTKTRDQESLNRALQRINYLSSMDTETWVEAGRMFKRLDNIFKKYRIESGYDVKRVRESLLFSVDANVTYGYISRTLNYILSEIQEEEERDKYYAEVMSKSVLVEFVKGCDPSLSIIFESFFNPSVISLPINELQMRLLLLSKHSLSQSHPSFYEGYYNAQTIYAGNPDLGYEIAMNFRRDLKNELTVLAMAGYTSALSRYGLNLIA